MATRGNFLVKLGEFKGTLEINSVKVEKIYHCHFAGLSIVSFSFGEKARRDG